MYLLKGTTDLFNLPFLLYFINNKLSELISRTSYRGWKKRRGKKFICRAGK